MSAISEALDPPAVEPQRESLMHHRHMNFDDVERLVKDPLNGIKQTNHLRCNCLTRAKGKETSVAQPKKDTGQIAPTDVVVAVICDVIEGPVDSNKNRYMINFVDRRSNNCR